METTAQSRYASVFKLVAMHKSKGSALDYTEWLIQFSNGKKKSLKLLNNSELKGFENYLKNPIETNDMMHDALRKAIISQFLSMGRTVGYAINWAETHSSQKEKKKFNLYTKKELALMLAISKEIKRQFEEKVWKETTN